IYPRPSRKENDIMLRAYKSAKTEPERSVWQKKLVEANMGLALNLSRKFLRGQTDGLREFMQAGAVGLVKAIADYRFDYQSDRLDEGQSVAFSSFAYPYIQNEMREQMRVSRSLVLSPHKENDVKIYQQTRQNLLRQLQRNPTVSEIGAHLQWTDYKVNQVAQLAQETMSLDLPQFDDSDQSVLDSMASHRPEYNPAHVVESEDSESHLARTIERLASKFPKPMQVMKLVLEGAHETGELPTNVDIASRLGVTPEAVRQHRKRGEDLLRQHLSM
ncbi:MAG: sigma-70 family RNA polymerase sigma factor, partial [Bdellovibrionales bacterium]|nr:sigma-70 family RNA polymerase sigma factor [Bdellovibrionales bacterium]